MGQNSVVRRVLVTAGSGLIGAAVVNRLMGAGIEVVVLDLRTKMGGLPPTAQIYARSSEPDAVERAIEGCTDVIHLEWSGGVRDAKLDPVGMHRRAVDASVRLLDLCRKQGARVVFASTCPYIGDRPTPSKESDPLSLKSIYAVQKQYIEAMTTAYARNYGLQTCSLRIFNAFGSGGRSGQILNQLRRVMSDETSLVMNGDGEQIRDFIHVDDVAAAFERALNASDLAGEAINIGTGVGTSMNEFCHLVGQICGKSILLDFVPAKQEESRFLIADCTRANDTLGWRASLSLEQGLRRVLL